MRCIANIFIQFTTKLLKNFTLWASIISVFLGVFLGFHLSLTQIRDILDPLTTLVSLLLAALGIWITLLNPDLNIRSDSPASDFKKNAAALLYLKFFAVAAVLLIFTIALLYITWGLVPSYINFNGRPSSYVCSVFKAVICSAVTGIYLCLIYISLSLILPVLRVHVFHYHNERKEKLAG